MVNRAARYGIFILLSLFASICIPACAEIPYESYTYWSDVDSGRKAVYNKAMFDVHCVIDAETIGVNEISKINDICTDKLGNTYILDNQSRIIVVDSDYKFLREIKEIGGKNYAEAQGIYAHSDGTIYICDTQNHRVLHTDMNGSLINTIPLPESPLIPEEFECLPVKLVVDSSGYIYVLSDGSYYGALLYDPTYNFLGFYGPNKIKGGLAGAFATIKDRIFSNSTKKSGTARALPYCFVDIIIDSEDFIYTATGYTEDTDIQGQIRKLSPGKGTNILSSDSVNFADEDLNYTYKDGVGFTQDILGVAVDNNLIYALDSAYGRVLVYDSDCRMITAFGGGMGYGNQEGTFKSACAIALANTDVLVADSSKATVTVFRTNEYGARVKELLSLTLSGKHIEAKDGWSEILKTDTNLQIAYSGLAKAYYKEGDYKQAMSISKKGYDRETYSLAYEAYRQNLIRENFAIIFIAIILLIALIGAFLIISMRRKLTLVKNPEWSLMLTTIIHPSRNFTEIEEKNKGSVGLSILLLVIYYVVTVLQDLMGGFLFTQYDPANYNSLLVLVRSMGIVVLWIISNWMICTLLGGKGKIRQILIVTCYSLMPIIISGIIKLVLTNVLLPAEASFLGIIDALAIIYTLILIVMSHIKIHDFTMTRFVGTSVLSVCCMAVIVFLIALVMLLIQQLGGFVVTVIMELLM